MWKLVIENLTHLGGPMGTEYTTSYFEVFETLKGAKEYAAKHYNNTRGPILWTKTGSSIYRSQDLGYVMYTIIRIKIHA